MEITTETTKTIPVPILTRCHRPHGAVRRCLGCDVPLRGCPNGVLLNRFRPIANWCAGCLDAACWEFGEMDTLDWSGAGPDRRAAA